MSEILTQASANLGLSISLAMNDDGSSTADENELCSFRANGAFNVNVVNQLIETNDRINYWIAKRLKMNDGDANQDNRIYDFNLHPNHDEPIFANLPASPTAYDFRVEMFACIDETTAALPDGAAPILITKGQIDIGFILDREYECYPGGFVAFSSQRDDSGLMATSSKPVLRVGFPGAAIGTGIDRQFLVIIGGNYVVASE